MSLRPRRANPIASPASIENKKGNTSSTIGWSFWSSFYACKRRWKLKYVDGIERIGAKEDYYLLGSVYHALHEGKTKDEIIKSNPEFAEHYDEAKRLFHARIMYGPKLPPALAYEKEFFVARGPLKDIYSSRIDRVEVNGKITVGREFKTQVVHSANDADYWRMNGEVIGELLTTGYKYITVDVISKRGEPEPMQYEVDQPSDELAEVFTDKVVRAAEYIRGNIDSGSPRDAAFPKDHTACIQRGQVCPFFQKCWGNGVAGALEYSRDEQKLTDRPWAKRLLK